MSPTRRELLGGLLLLLTACTERPAPTRVPIDPDVALREAALAREHSLLQAYDAVLLALPALGGRLLPVRAEHVAHLAALTGPTPTPSSAASAASGPAATPVPQTAMLALAELVQAERATATGHAGDVAAASRSLAAVLAALSASEASHAVVLV
ncbi:MAG: hypothetical protein H7323_15425 [Frankiales bacterium]|nr:hypothetical protein [Frankiales bacterium]